jgi:hypothetical protein
MAVGAKNVFLLAEIFDKRFSCQKPESLWLCYIVWLNTPLMFLYHICVVVADPKSKMTF